MKEISASIVVLAAAVIIVGGFSSQDHDLRTFALLVGSIVGITGLCVWIGSLSSK